MKRAIAGKGGPGKTTICGTLPRKLARQGYEVLAVDNDIERLAPLTNKVRDEHDLAVVQRFAEEHDLGVIGKLARKLVRG